METPLVKGLSEKIVAYQPILARLTGRVADGLLLSQIMYWHGVKRGGTFYKTDREFADELGMGIDELRGAKKRLIEAGYIAVVKLGIPQKTHYRLNVETAETKLGSLLKQEWGDSPNCSGETAHSTTENTQENTTEVVAPSKEGLPVSLGKSQTARIASVYGLLFKERYQTDYKVSNWPALTKLYKPLLKDFSEWQVAALIILHFDWRGASGQDEFVYRRLSEKRFPLEWVPKALNEYRPYFQEHMGFSFDDEETIKRHVTAIIKPLYQKYGQPNS